MVANKWPALVQAQPEDPLSVVNRVCEIIEREEDEEQDDEQRRREHSAAAGA